MGKRRDWDASCANGKLQNAWEKNCPMISFTQFHQDIDTYLRKEMATNGMEIHQQSECYDTSALITKTMFMFMMMKNILEDIAGPKDRSGEPMDLVDISCKPTQLPCHNISYGGGFVGASLFM